MQIGIIGGTGPEGRGVAARLGAAGVHTLLGSRDLDRAREVATTIAQNDAIEPATNDTVIERSGVIFLTVPFSSLSTILGTYGARLQAGTVVVDVTVPMTFEQGRPTFHEVAEGSATEFIRARLPAPVRVAAALKTIPASVLVRTDTPLDCDEFVCGDSPEATVAAMEALQMIPGLRPIDAGGLDAARALERMTFLAVGINKRYRVRTARFRVVGV